MGFFFSSHELLFQCLLVSSVTGEKSSDNLFSLLCRQPHHLFLCMIKIQLFLFVICRYISFSIKLSPSVPLPSTFILNLNLSCSVSTAREIFFYYSLNKYQFEFVLHASYLSVVILSLHVLYHESVSL